MSDTTLEVVGDLARNFRVTDMVISSLWRTKPNSPYTHSKNPSTGIDITYIKSEYQKEGVLFQDTDPRQPKRKQPELAKVIKNWLSSNKDVTQVFDPWTMNYNTQKDNGRTNDWKKGRNSTFYNSKGKEAGDREYKMDYEHRHHIHITTK